MRDTAKKVWSAPAARSLRATWTILCLALTATGLVTWATYRTIATTANRQFTNECEIVTNAVDEVMRAYQQVLLASSGLFNVQGSVTRREWRIFINSLQLPEKFPGVQGVGWVKVIPQAELKKHIDQIRREGRADYEVRPAGDREIYTSIVYLEPEDERNAAAIGYDMFSDPTRRAAMEAARDNGTTQMTHPVSLVQYGRDESRTGILMYFPVYEAGTTPASIEARRKSLRGFVYVAFRAHDLFQKSLARLSPQSMKLLTLNIYDGFAPHADNLLFESELTPAEPSRFQISRTYASAGQTWTLKFRSQPAFESNINWWQAGLVAGVGSLMTLLISAIAAALAVSRDRAVEAQQVLAKEVFERKRAQEQVQIANRELIHRVKNMMAVVASIASQTARYTPNPAQFNIVFRERLAALGRVQDMLRPNPAYQPELGQLLLEVLQPYSAHRSGALVTSGPKIEIPQNAAVMLSLVVNELGTNATKHGAWTRLSGHVELTWTVESGERGDIVEILWKEVGGPVLLTLPTRKGFGSNVLKFAVERGLQGTFDSDFKTDGVVCRLTFPLNQTVAHDTTASALQA